MNTEVDAEALKKMSKEEVYSFIRERLAFDDCVVSSMRHGNVENDHLRFEMSGYEGKTGVCTLHNLYVLNKFADLGIYDYTRYLFLDFYKGVGTLYYMYFFEDLENFVMELAGHGTVEIIYKIFEATIWSGKKSRRRR